MSFSILKVDSETFLQSESRKSSRTCSSQLLIRFEGPTTFNVARPKEATEVVLILLG